MLNLMLFVFNYVINNLYDNLLLVVCIPNVYFLLEVNYYKYVNLFIYNVLI